MKPVAHAIEALICARGLCGERGERGRERRVWRHMELMFVLEFV